VSDIVPFPAKQEPMIWVCECGCSSFELLNDGTMQCALCGCMPADGAWDPVDSDEVWTGESRIREVSGNGDPDFAKKVTAKRIMDPDTVLSVVIKANGALSAWSSLETSEKVEWGISRLEDLQEILKPRKEAHVTH
jgi:hypothetical protein